MEMSTPESLEMVEKRVKASISGQMDQVLKVSGFVTRWKETEHLRGQMGNFTKDSGKILRCTERVSSDEWMVPTSKDSTILIKNMGLGRWATLTARSTLGKNFKPKSLAIGNTGCHTVKEPSSYQEVISETASGRMEEE